MTDGEVIAVVIPAGLTIVGWAIGAIWAVRQENEANRKAYATQRLLMRES